VVKIPDRSAYILELSVQPGGSRWAEEHVYAKLEHIRAVLEAFCKNDSMAAYHAIWYGTTLAIWVVQKGLVVQYVDLHPHIQARLDDFPPLAITDREGCLELIRKCRNRQGPNAHNDADDDDWFDEDIEALQRMRLECAWLEVAPQLPELEPPLVQPGQKIRIKHKKKPKLPTYVETGVHLYGSYDHEAGIDLVPPFDVTESESKGK